MDSEIQTSLLSTGMAFRLMIFPNFNPSKHVKAEILSLHIPLCLPRATLSEQLRLAKGPHFHGKGYGWV